MRANHIPALVVLGGLAVSTAAHADPCTARASGYRPGEVVSGTIRYVGDGDSLCIGQSRDPSTWIEIRLADWFAPELHDVGGRQAKKALEQLLGQSAVCTATRGSNGRTASYDRLIAVCSVRGRSVADQMRRAGIDQGGRGRLQAATNMTPSGR